MLELITVEALLIDADVTGPCDGHVSNSSCAPEEARKEIKILQVRLVKPSLI